MRRDLTPPFLTHPIARQPLFNQFRKVIGYALLAAPDDAFPLAQHAAEMGIERVGHNRKVFVRCSFQELLEASYAVLPPTQVILELGDDVKPTLQAIDAILRAKSMGFRVALTDFVYHETLDDLVEIADVVMLNFEQQSPQQIRWTLSGIKSGAEFVARGIRCAQDYQSAILLGFDLFQGEYLAAPHRFPTTIFSRT